MLKPPRTEPRKIMVLNGFVILAHEDLRLPYAQSVDDGQRWKKSSHGFYSASLTSIGSSHPGPSTATFRRYFGFGDGYRSVTAHGMHLPSDIIIQCPLAFIQPHAHTSTTTPLFHRVVPVVPLLPRYSIKPSARAVPI